MFHGCRSIRKPLGSASNSQMVSDWQAPCLSISRSMEMAVARTRTIKSSGSGHTQTRTQTFERQFQIECQKIWQIDCQKRCEIECQVECQMTCQIECQMECQKEYRKNVKRYVRSTFYGIASLLSGQIRVSGQLSKMPWWLSLEVCSNLHIQNRSHQKKKVSYCIHRVS